MPKQKEVKTLPAITGTVLPTPTPEILGEEKETTSEEEILGEKTPTSEMKKPTFALIKQIKSLFTKKENLPYTIAVIILIGITVYVFVNRKKKD